VAWSALAVLLAASPGDADGAAPAEPASLGAIRLNVLRANLDALALHSAPRRKGARPVSAPVCSGDVCQPIVAVPGFEPSYSIRGKRTELTLKLLQRFPVEPFATVIWALATAGVRLDWTPPQLAPDHYPPGYSGLGSFEIELRWKLDARGLPVFASRKR
jgi:hypothetical protein